MSKRLEIHINEDNPKDFSVDFDPNETFEEVWRYFTEDNLIFTSARYPRDPQGGFASTFWKVDPTNHTQYYIEKLADFYDALRTSNFNQADAAQKETGIIYSSMNQNGSQKFLLLSDGESDLDKRLSELNINFVKFQTPYGDFGMQMQGMNPLTHQSESNWSPENGLLFVNTHQDLSEPLAELISDTARDSIKSEDIQPYLRMIYSFQ